MNIIHTVERKVAKGHTLLKKCLLKLVIEETIGGGGGEDKYVSSYQMTLKRGYWNLNEEAVDATSCFPHDKTIE
jgi:hypothetical protein